MVLHDHDEAFDHDEPSPALPELAAACRVLLRTVGLEARWTDRGPDAQAATWLVAGDGADDCPPALTPDQWTMLRVCWGLWSEESLFSSIVLLPARPALALASFIAAQAVDGLAIWTDSHLL